jgi:multisubunit Na+/H+ antiporter MnhG subunit
MLALGATFYFVTDKLAILKYGVLYFLIYLTTPAVAKIIQRRIVG